MSPSRTRRPVPPIRRQGRGAAAACLLLLALPATAAIERYEGTAHARDGGGVLYRETHWRLDSPGDPSRVVVYTCPDGEAFARKRVWGPADAVAPRFEFVDGRDGYREGVRSTPAGLEVFWQPQADAPERRQAIAAGPGAVFDAGFDALVRSGWDTLVAGDPVQAAFLLPSRLDVIDVKVRRQEDDAGGLLRLRMTLDAWYGFVAPGTDLTYTRDDRWLLRFEGIGTIRDAEGRHQDVRIEFPPDRRVAGVARAELDAALSQPLARRCGAG